MALCPNCGEENPDRARLCMMCGTALNAAPAPQAEERKVVSVLFVDLVGFTARSHDADPEDVRAALAPYHRLLKTEIERFGGTVEKFIGDAVMAVFGAPVAHEDDAERAVRAALRITEAIEELNQATPNLDLSIRAAVNTGEGLVSLGARPQAGEGMVTGDVVNTASRLQGIAPVGGVAVGEITYRSTKDFISYEPLDPVTVKGKPEPIPVWRAVSARSRFGVDFRNMLSTPLVARDYELGAIKNSYFRSLRESSVQLVTIIGEPGVGKSRVVAEFWKFIDQEQPGLLISWRQGRCLPYGEGITFWALGEVVKAHAGILDSNSPEEASAKLRMAVRVLVQEPSDADWIAARLAPLVGATRSPAENVERSESFTAWRRFLEAIAAQGPFVVVFEDLHWADEALLEFIDDLVEWSTGVSLLVLCTARPELYGKHPGWGGGKRNSNTIALSPLTDGEVGQLISALLSQAVLPAEVHSAVLERAGGNPLYTEEFVRMLMDRGVFERSGRVLKLRGDADIPVPESLQALIAARLDTLPPDLKSVLQDAAVVGKVFWSGAVCALGGLEEQTARTHLHELTRRELLRPDRESSIKDESEYSFWHLLVRDVCYGQIPRQARANKHVAASSWIERIAGERMGDQAELLVHHYDQARQLLQGAGIHDEAEGLEAPLMRALVLSGNRAAQLDANRAYVHYRRALDLAPEDHGVRPQLLHDLGKIARLLGLADEARTYLGSAADEYRKRGDALGEGQAITRLASVEWQQGGTARSHELDLAAIRLLEGQVPGKALAYAYNGAAWDAFFAGHPGEASEWSEKARLLAEQLNLPSEMIGALTTRGQSRCQLGDLDGIADLREALSLALGHGLAEDTSLAYTNLGDWVWLIEGPQAGLATYEEGVAYCERRGLTEAVYWLKAQTLWTLYDLGDWDETASRARSAVEWSRANGETQIEAMALPYHSLILAQQGAASEAASLVDEFLPLARQIEDMQILVPALGSAALVKHLEADDEASIELLAELQARTEESPPWRARFATIALRVLTSVGEMKRARAWLPATSVGLPRDRCSVLTGRAILAEAEDSGNEATDLYVQVAQRWKDYGHLPEHGQAFLGAARCLIALGDREAAIEPLQKGRTIFERLGAVSLLNEVDGYMGDMQAASG